MPKQYNKFVYLVASGRDFFALDLLKQRKTCFLTKKKHGTEGSDKCVIMIDY